MRILVVVDDPGVREVLTLYLTREGYQVVEVEDAKSVLDKAPTCDVVILDATLPDVNGLDIATLLSREHPESPVLILTARETENRRVYGLELGVADYVVKPFSPREVVARVRGLLRRVGPRGDLRYGELSIQPATREVFSRSKPVPLTKLEFDLLLILAQHPGMVWPSKRLLERVWGSDFPGTTRVVDVSVAALRKKLGDDEGSGRYIETVQGVGYRFRDL